MDHPDASVADVVGILKAPDFPTGALVHGLDGFSEAVETGRGRVKIRAKWHEEDRGRGAKAIIIDELPYQVNKANLVAHIALLVRDKKVEDIVGLRDESNKEGIRIWIALKKDASPEAIFSELVSLTDLEVSMNYNCMVLVNGQPMQLGIKQIIIEWIKFRQKVVLARYVFERKQALAKLHILAGYMQALEQLDAVIKTIRSASGPSDAKASLIELLTIDDLQAQAILDLRLQKLTGMELDSIRAEHAQVIAKVAGLTEVIDDPLRIDSVIREELAEIAKRYGIERRTEIGYGISDVTREDLIPREEVLIAMTNGGYIKRMPVNTMERQNRGTRGKKAMEVGDDDSIRFMKQAHSHDSLMMFAKSGQVYGIKTYRIPEGSLTQKGRHIRRVIDGLEEDIHVVLALPEKDSSLSVLTITRSGQAKRTAIDDYANATRRGGIRGVGLDDGDELIGVFVVREEDHVMLMSSEGNAIRFKAADVRVMGRTAGGVRGMKLGDGESIVGAAIVANGDDPSMFILCAGTQGIGKRTPISDFPVQGRAGGGVIAFKANIKTGFLVTAMAVTEADDLIMFASNGVSNRISVKDIRETGRAASGVILMNLDVGQTLVSATTTLRDEVTEVVKEAEVVDV
jgi:DNA gyrase subunit A